METSKLSGWSMLRAVMPPWKDLGDPLVQYDIHLHRRAGRRPWGAILLGWGTLILLNLYLLAQLLGSNIGTWVDPYEAQDFDNLLINSLLYLGVGLVLISMVGHWRLLMAVSARAAAIIAGRRGRGDWDLIAITPVDKSRWLRAQLVTIGWQVFPIVRLLMAIQLVLVLIVFGQLIRLQYSERQNELEYEAPCQAGGGCNANWYNDDYLPTGIYTLAILPFGVMIVWEPLVTIGIFAAVSLYLSSHSQRTTMSLLYSFFSIYLTRVFLSLVLLVGGALIFMAVTGIASAFGLWENDWDLTEIGEVFGLMCLWLCISVLILAFFLEWIPALAPLLLMVQMEVGEHITLYVFLILTFLLAYLLAPLGVMRYVGGRTVDRLNRREI